MKVAAKDNKGLPVKKLFVMSGEIEEKTDTPNGKIYIFKSGCIGLLMIDSFHCSLISGIMKKKG